MRWLVTALAASAAALVAVLINIQVVHADEYVVKPHLGVQADGGRRYAYNPRVLDLVRQLPRGTVYDRNGLPLATEDPGVIDAARQAYQRLGVSLDRTCPTPSERCYPLGGRAFHLLGDERTRVNWSAPNTSYVERDSENRLRGFDDRATTTQTSDSSGRADVDDSTGLPRSRAVVAAPLRAGSSCRRGAAPSGARCAPDDRRRSPASRERRSSRATRGSRRGRAAAIVLDPDTGELLASASYPWPEAGTPEATRTTQKRPRIRCWTARDTGSYPPGSTFKLVTAAAALRQRRRSRRDHVRVRALAGRQGRRQDQGLESTDPG